MEYIVAFAEWSDEKILATCVRYGEEARKWKNRFLGLLPEVERRRLYVKKGFTSVVHFAQVVGGVSEAQVKRALSLHERFEETPALQNLLTSGEVSVNKLAKIASIAEPENEIFLADQVQMVSARALETLVRDAKYADPNFVHVNKSEPDHKLALAEDVEEGLAELQSRGIDIDAELRLFLEQRKVQIEAEKEKIGESCSETNSRYVPKEVRDVLAKEYGTKCSVPGCVRPSEELHHTQRFSMSKRHDPRYMALLCREHHQIAHSKDVRVQEMRARKRK